MGEYNIDYKREDIEDVVNIADFIKNDVILIDDNKNAVVNIHIEKLKSKDINLSSSDIDLKNLPPGLAANVNSTDDIQIEVLGEEALLSDINKYNLKPYIDLSDSGIGTKFFNIQFNPPGGDLTIIGGNSISVTISEAAG